MTPHIQRAPVRKLNDQRIIAGKIHLIGKPAIALLERLVPDLDSAGESMHLYVPLFYVGNTPLPDAALAALLPPEPIYYEVLDPRGQKAVYTPICTWDSPTGQWKAVSDTSQDAMIRVAQSKYRFYQTNQQ